jgi:beta-xylosidase
MLTGIGQAAAPDRAWPSVVVAPLLDVPMRDTSICRGPDDAYYLTGTLGPDFDNAKQIRVWQSKDLKSWKELGVAWDIEKDVHKSGRSTWQTYWQMPLGPEDKPMARGITAPEIHYFRDTFWICFSINQCGTALLKSTSGKAEGPYADRGRITARGGDPSIFVDDPPSSGDSGVAGDGKVYWLLDGGWIARMKDDLTGLAEAPRLLSPAPDPTFDLKGGRARDEGPRYPDHPRQIGRRGAFMFKSDGRYFLTGADYNGRIGTACDDTWIAWADNINGPYSERHLMVPHGGGITVFTGPATTAVKNPDGKEPLYATFFGNDRAAIFRDRPGIVPLKWTAADDWDVYFFKKSRDFPRKPQHIFTERGPWAHMKPLVGLGMRDLQVVAMPDGFYYLNGGTMTDFDKLSLIRSKDLKQWEVTAPVWRIEDVPWIKETPTVDFSRCFWRSLSYEDDTYCIRFGVSGGAGILKSKTGRVEGPYEFAGRPKGGGLADPVGQVSVFEGRDGKKFANRAIHYKPHVAEVPPNEPDVDKWPFKPVDIGAGVSLATDGFGQVDYLAGKYVIWALRWGGPVANVHGTDPEYAKHYGSYDWNYAVADTPWGPFGRPRPIARSGGIFQDKEGRWWMGVFGNDQASMWWEKPGLAPMRVERRGEDLIIEVQNDNFTADQLAVMGAGERAEVKTVPEVLP